MATQRGGNPGRGGRRGGPAGGGRPDGRKSFQGKSQGASRGRPGAGRSGPAGPGAGGARAGKGRPAGGKRPIAKPRSALRVTAVGDAAAQEAATADGKIRLNRFLASAGICSRRAADERIAGGHVTINGEVVTELGTRIDPLHDDVRYDEQRVQPERPVYVLFNKPAGVVCTNAANEQRVRAIDHLQGVRARVFSVGRLDADSEGLLLLTNDGRFANAIAHPSHGVWKTYAVLIRGVLEAKDLEKLSGGVWLSDGKTSGFRVQVVRRSRDRTYCKVSLREGRNREIRRAFARLGHNVTSLKRVRIGHLTLHGLGRGRWRYLQRSEIDRLLAEALDERGPSDDRDDAAPREGGRR